MKFKLTVTAEQKRQMLDVCLGKMRVALDERFPNVEHVKAIALEYVSQITTESKAKSPDASVSEIGLDERIAIALQNAGFLTVRALTACSANELSDNCNFGPSRLEAVRTALGTIGQCLRGDGAQASAVELLALGKKKFRA